MRSGAADRERRQVTCFDEVQQAGIWHREAREGGVNRRQDTP